VKESEAAAQRERMVREQIAGRGIRNAAVLAAMRRVPREEFVAAGLREQAYEDSPLPIAKGQTISQPFIVATMLEAMQLRRFDRVLEIGAGSGYACAVASLIAAHVDAVERHRSLCDEAGARLRRLGFANVALHCADGSAGWVTGAPYDAILVSAAGPHVPDLLRRQLAIGGRLVMPVGEPGFDQHLCKLTRHDEDTFVEADLGGVVFVPLIGEHGWPADSA
jgi:protein-L-isoaspartate(D-aspartate) O-methyltransferase